MIGIVPVIFNKPLTVLYPPAPCLYAPITLDYRDEIAMTEPVVAQKSPFPVDVEEGKSYYWCACGKSANQPFCDGSHQDTDILPVKFDATESKTVYFCGCKATKGGALCDGSHNAL